jgi:hypothetical protein
MSYYDYFIINIKNNKSKEFLEILLNKYSVGNDTNDFNQQMKLYNIILYTENGRLLGPIEFFYSSNIFVILSVSIITDQIYDLLSLISKDNKDDIDIKFTHKFNLFVLAGKTCLSKILSVFTESNIDINIYNNLNNEKESLINYIEKGEDGSMILFKIKQPQSIFKLNELIYKNTIKENSNKNELMSNLFLNSSIKKNIINDEFINLFNSDSTDYISYKKKYLENDNFDDKGNQTDKNDYFNFSNITERTTFMHRKKVNLKNLNQTLSKSIKEFKKGKNDQPILTQPKKEISDKYTKGKVYKKE